MDPSQNRIELLSSEDRVVYRQWLRRTVLFYSSIVAVLVLVVVANQMFTSTPSDVADETMHTASIAAQK
jgi:hypothetical protein